MEESVRARLPGRGIHISSAGLPSYCLLPPDRNGAGFPRETVVHLFLVPSPAFEAYRWARRPAIFGLRENRERRVSAVAWGAVGPALSFAFFPQDLVIPCVPGLAFVDPLFGALRQGWSKGHPCLPAAVYFLICLACGLGWAPSLLATAVAPAAEAPKVSQADDDFRMLVAPPVALWVHFRIPG